MCVDVFTQYIIELVLALLLQILLDQSGKQDSFMGSSGLFISV